VVVVINQMTSKTSFGSEPSEMEVNGTDLGSTKLIPALGESWAHATTTRLLLMIHPNSNGSFENDRRVCKLVKSANKPCGTALFTVTKSGVRDCTPTL
jgi:RAD51-like protein 2